MPVDADKTGTERLLQSHAGESKLQAQAGESSDAESVIFKEHFGGQEASKRGAVGGGHSLPNTPFQQQASSSSPSQNPLSNSKLQSIEAV